MTKAKSNNIVLFDGACNLCHKSVQFIIRNDPKVTFQFAALQSSFGERLIREHDYSVKMDSLILFENSHLHDKSSAALRIARRLNGLWPVFYLFIIVPKPIRDYFYDLIAKNRYKIFGEKEICSFPNSVDHKRFIP